MSDTVAMGVLQAINDRGRQAGRRRRRGGRLRRLARRAGGTGLTSVRQPLEEVAVQIVRLLEDRLAMRSSEEPHVILTPELRVRGTS